MLFINEYSDFLNLEYVYTYDLPIADTYITFIYCERKNVHA